MSISHYVIIDTNTKQVYNKRTGRFVGKLTESCLYTGVRKGRRGTIVPSKHCNDRHLKIWNQDTDRSVEVHLLLKVVADSGHDALHGRPYVQISLPE